jgi:hypothetical protein
MSGGCVLYGVMLRRFILALGLVMLPLTALADPTAAPPNGADQVHNGGTITGRVTTIDYQRSMLGVNAPGRGHLVVSVMPSTSIQGKDSAYHAFTDLKTGQRVQILCSIAGGSYVAQIIRIR